MGHNPLDPAAPRGLHFVTRASPQIQVDADVVSVLSYALAHNRVPVVRHLQTEIRQ